MTNYQRFFNLHDCTFKRMVKKNQKSMSNIRNKIFDILLMYFHNDGFDGSSLSFNKAIYTFINCHNNHYIPQRMIVKHGSIIFSDSSSSLEILNILYEHFRKISTEIIYCFRADTSQTKIKKYLDNSYYCYSNHVFNSL